MKKIIYFSDSIKYILAMVLANISGTAAMLFVMSILSKSNNRDSFVKNYRLSAIIFSLVGIAVTTMFTAWYFNRKLSNILVDEPQSNTKDILKNFCLLTLPGELLRFILSILPVRPGGLFGYRLFEGFLSFPPSLLYDWFYMMPNNRLENIRKMGYTATDNLLFILIYFIYFIMIMSIFSLVFLQRWKRIEKLQKDETRSE